MLCTLDSYKLSCELFGHSKDVRSVAAGADVADGGQRIVSGSRDKTTKIWNPLDNCYIEAVTLQDHKNFVSCVFYSERDGWLCTGSNDSTVCIYNENSMLPILILKGHESTVCSIAAGVESQSLITGSWDKTARIWSINKNGDVKFVELKGHEAAVWAVTSMPKSKQFVTGSADKNIFYWNANGKKLRMLKGHTDCVRGILALSNGGLVSCANDAIIRVWNDDGECVQQMSGHTNYIYAVVQHSISKDCILSCGEDSTLRMWDISTGLEVGLPLVHSTQSVWSVACLKNGDIVTGSSDGIVRVFTKDSQRMASEDVLKAYQSAVDKRQEQMFEELGGVKRTDLPGPEALLNSGTREGQTKMVRHPDGSVKCYIWELSKWNLVGDVTGASGGSQASSGKTLYEGKEFDYVFSVDISDTEPPLKLPYNCGEDPWQAAQTFIHRNNLPQVYLDQVANFVIKNSSNTPVQTSASSGAYKDPFTGGNRYVPGTSNTNIPSTGNADPFTGASSYTTAAANQSVPKVDVTFVTGDKHFPICNYMTFDNCDPTKVLEKLKEFNYKLPACNEKVSDNLLESVIRLANAMPDVDQTAIEALQVLLRWPNEYLFPVIDIVRMAVRNEEVFSILNSMNFLDCLLLHITSSAPNQLMIIRCLANIMKHEAGRQQVNKHLTQLIDHINSIKSGSNNLQIAIATFYLNQTVTQTTGIANGQKCRLVTEGLVEFLKWAVDLEACYRSMQAIGNLTTTPFGQEVSAIVISADYVMDKLRELTNTPQTGVYVKINSAGSALLKAF